MNFYALVQLLNKSAELRSDLLICNSLNDLLAFLPSHSLDDGQ